MCCEDNLALYISLSLSPVVTGATDGIGKSYAEEVRLQDPYLFNFCHGESVTRAHTHTHTPYLLIGHWREKLLWAY